MEFFMTEQIRAAAAAKTDTAGGGRRHGAVAGLSTQNGYSILPTVVGTSTVLTSRHMSLKFFMTEQSSRQRANTAGGDREYYTLTRRGWQPLASTVLV